jgi:hypothetical protein
VFGESALAVSATSSSVWRKAGEASGRDHDSGRDDDVVWPSTRSKRSDEQGNKYLCIHLFSGVTTAASQHFCVPTFTCSPSPSPSPVPDQTLAPASTSPADIITRLPSSSCDLPSTQVLPHTHHYRQHSHYALSNTAAMSQIHALSDDQVGSPKPLSGCSFVPLSSPLYVNHC